jgi:hypothetical protein
MSRTLARTPEAEIARYGWISTGKAAERIGGDVPVSTSHVLRLIAAGELRARNVAMPGSKRPDWRVDPKSVDKFLADRTVGPEAG